MSVEGFIGIFGGTFDPIHLGHLNLAINLLEKCRLAKILFIPAFISPLRMGENPVAPQKRLEMVRLAVEGIPHFEVSDIEIRRGGPSYTVDTLRLLKKEFPDIALLLGEDSLETFPRWKESDTIVREVPIRVGSRRVTSKILHEGLIDIPLFDISATDLRDRLKKRLYCGHLIPPKVLDYIHENQLYSSLKQ